MPFLSIVLGFAFLIFIHELGHFLVARWCGIRCPQFAIGFGQALLSWRKGFGLKAGSSETDYAARAFAELEKTRGPLDEEARAKVDPADLHAAADSLGLGATEYRLNWLPLGGYVKMVGQEDMDPSARSKDPNAFSNKSAKARAAVLVAGVVMNLITGLVFFVVAFSGGVEFPAAKVGQVVPGSPAEKAGMQPGDEILTVDGKKVTDFTDLKMEVVLADGQKPLALEILRDGEKKTLHAIPEYNKAQGMQTLGFLPAVSLGLIDPTQVKQADLKVLQKTPFGAISGASPKITAVDGMKVANFQALQQALQKSQGHLAKIQVTSAAGAQEVTVTPDMDTGIWMAAGDDNQVFNPLGLSPVLCIDGVTPNSPAAAAGLQANDIVLAINNLEIPAIEQFQEAVKQGGKGGVSLTLERNGEKLAPIQIQPKPLGKLGFLGLGDKTVGVQLGYAFHSNRVLVDAKTRPNLSLPRGSQLVSLAGETVTGWNDIQRILVAHQKDAAVEAVFVPRIGVKPTFEKHGLTLGPKLQVALAKAQFSLPSDTPLKLETTVVTGANPLDSARIGILKTRNTVVQTYITIARLIQGKVGSENINGVIGIVAGGAKVAETGDVMRMLYLLGIISINLAVMNLLPIPVLDGGHLVFLAYEKITGKPLSEKVQTVAFYIGIALLGSLMLYATWNDLVKLFH